MQRDEVKLNLKLFTKILKKAWSKETSYWPEKWNPKKPSIGQCAVTALLLQNYAGGKILQTKIPNYGTHLWNKLPNGKEIDLTRNQFPKRIKIPKGKVISRSTLLKVKSLRKRYNTLIKNFEKELTKIKS